MYNIKTNAIMAIFETKKFRPSSYDSSTAAKYRRALAKHPFALFGLPFIATMVLGSFFLTPATAMRYERFDRKVKQISQEEALGMTKNKRKIDLKEEYYVRSTTAAFMEWWMLTRSRNSLPKISTTGNRSASSACLVNTMAFCDTT